MKHYADKNAGKRLREARWLNQMSQQELAEKIGVKFQQVQKYETGANRLSASRLVMCCEALGVTPSYFFLGLGLYGEDEMPSINREHAAIIAALDRLGDDDKAAIKKMITTLGLNR